MLITGCSGPREYDPFEDWPEHCEYCSRELNEEEGYISASNTVEGINLCYKCAMERGYTTCRKCGQYYERDVDEGSSHYCRECVEKNTGECAFCGAQNMEWETLVEFSVNGEKYYMCVDCAADYFRNVEPMKPCYYCIECGHLSNEKTYPMGGWNDGFGICEDCIKKGGYFPCENCHKYVEELHEGLCDKCGEEENK